MKALFLLLFLFLIELSYFRIANYFNIIDKPNKRSLHTKITIRGGGILFAIGALLFFIYSNFAYYLFFIGFISIVIISFLDDIYTLPSRYRLPIHLFAIIMLLIETHLNALPTFFIISYLIMGIGIINAYNFMDGINGITGGYSIVILISLWIINTYYKSFIENEFLLSIFSSVLVFNFFNFRKEAVCFAGDVGSISIGIIILFLITKISISDNNPIFFLFLSIYGVDSLLTILYRLKNRENIFQAHRSHLFQIIVFQKSVPHLIMAGIYSLLQFLICILIISQLHKPLISQYFLGFSIITILIISYLFIRYKVLNGFSTTKQ